MCNHRNIDYLSNDDKVPKIRVDWQDDKRFCHILQGKIIIVDSDRQVLFKDNYELDYIILINFQILMGISEVNELNKLLVEFKSMPSCVYW